MPPPLKSDKCFEFCHNLDMNYRKFTNETDFYSQKDALACGHVNFSFKMTEKKLNIKNPPSPPWTFFFKNFIFSLES